MKIAHALKHGLPMCGFMPGTVPGDWPAGHIWVSFYEWGLMTCSLGPHTMKCVACDVAATERPRCP